MKTRKESHTPTPWRLEDGSDARLIAVKNGVECCIMAILISDADDVKYAIKAVNAHEKLVEACRKSLSYLQEDDREYSFREVVSDILSALALAEKGE